MRGSYTTLLLAAATAGACSAELAGPGVPGAAGDAGALDAAATDASPDGPAPLGPWGPPARIVEAGGLLNEDDGTLSPSGLELVFAVSDPTDDDGRKHLYRITRATPTATTWSTREKLALAVTGSTEQTPRMSADGLTLYFGSNRIGTTGGLDIWSATRAAAGDPWPATAALVPGINSAADEKWLALCGGDRYLMISGRAGGGTGEDVFQGVLGVAAPARVDLLSTTGGETGTFVTADCLTAYFASTVSGDNAIYRTTRASPDDAWPAATPVIDFAALGGDQEDPWLSADGRTFVFASDVRGSKDLYLSTR